MADERPTEISRHDEPVDPVDADAPSDEVTPPDAAGDKQPEREWWDDPGMPWRRKPTRTDLICMSWIGFLGVFSLAMLPLRAWLLGAPERLPWLVGLLGSRSGTTLLGSVIRVGTDLPFVWPILLGTLMSIKLDWTYWWAGKLWGRGMIEVGSANPSAPPATTPGPNGGRTSSAGWASSSPMFPIPLPLTGVIFVLAGAQGMSWKKFMLLGLRVLSVVDDRFLLVRFSGGSAGGQGAGVLQQVRQLCRDRLGGRRGRAYLHAQ